MDKTSEKERINEIIEAIMKVARGDYSVQVELSGKNDEIDSLAMGLNMMIEDIRTSEEVLKESEEKSRTFMETASDLMHMADKNGNITYVNESMARTLGYSKEEMIGMHITQLASKEALEKDFKPSWDTFITNGEIALDTTFTAKDGKDVYGEIKAVAIYDSDCEYSGSRAVFRDLTERKRMEHDLNERVKELQCLYSIAYIAERPGMTLDELCQEVANLLPAGWQYPEITCARVTLGDKEFRADNFKATEWKLSANINVKGQKEGTIEVCYLEARPEINEGPFSREERLLIDAVAERLGRVTEHMQAEAELKSSEERLKILFEFAPDAYYLNDLKGNFVDGNKVAEEITGYTKDELIGKSFLKLKLLSVKQIPRAAALLARNVLGKATGPDEFILNRKGGNQVPVEIRTFPVKIQGKTLVLGIARDITERKRAEEEMRSFNELAVDRELRMVELKKEINTIFQKLGEAPRYKIVE